MKGFRGKAWRFWGWTALVLAGGLLTCQASECRAEPVLRVKKNGVVHYYFSDRGQLRAGAAAQTLRRPPRRPALPASCSPQEMNALIREVSRHHNLPPALVKAVIRVESNFNPAATSPKGAQGLMQLMPQTADELGMSNPYDIRENVWGGTRYLWLMLQKFNNRLPLALAAYNAGPQRVEGRQAVPPIKETQDFVRDVCSQFLQYRSEDPASP